VCEAQVPFVHGGAELHVRQLVRELCARGYLAELVSVPFKWYPKEEILPHAAAWRLLDLSESNGRAVDLVIASKFPTYFVRHPNKIAWLIHQYRAAYELCGTAYSDFSHDEFDVGLRKTLMRLDNVMLGECRTIFTNARNTAARLEKFNGITAEPLYHPPNLAGRLKGGPYGDYVLSVGRIEATKRVDLLIEAMDLAEKSLRLIVVGEGTGRDRTERLVADRGLFDRVTFRGVVDDDELIDLYAGALAVAYPPFDEDFGYVTLEAFHARKAVITCTDSGGPLEFVRDGINGMIVEPHAEAIAAAMSRLASNKPLAKSFGDAGYEVAAAISWDHVISRLLSHG
jgi:glycosyltransferase involved in cell wall biosynthesis